MSTRERSEGSKNSEPEVNSGHRYTYRDMVSYSMRVRAINPPVFSEVNSNISVYRWTNAMELNFCDERIPYSIWIMIAFRFLMRHATQWWCRQKYHLESYHWEWFVFITLRFFGTSRGVVNDEEEVLEVESDPAEHMESSVGEN